MANSHWLSWISWLSWLSGLSWLWLSWHSISVMRAILAIRAILIVLAIRAIRAIMAIMAIVAIVAIVAIRAIMTILSWLLWLSWLSGLLWLSWLSWPSFSTWSFPGLRIFFADVPWCFFPKSFPFYCSLRTQLQLQHWYCWCLLQQLQRRKMLVISQIASLIYCKTFSQATALISNHHTTWQWFFILTLQHLLHSIAHHIPSCNWTKFEN